MKNCLQVLLSSFLYVFIIIAPVYAVIGVGVGTGKIQVEDKLKSGMSYTLPPLTVLNTGDVASDYEVSIAYHQDQPELAPLKEWFNFSPKKFYLEPGGAQVVEIKLNLPLKTTPGDYFAYLEGFPAKKSHSGSTTIGVAAAAKLYFTIEPANLLEAIYYKITAFWVTYSPWTSISAGMVLTGVFLKFFKKFFNVQINVKKKGKVENE